MGDTWYFASVCPSLPNPGSGRLRNKPQTLHLNPKPFTLLGLSLAVKEGKIENTPTSLREMVKPRFRVQGVGFSHPAS